MAIDPDAEPGKVQWLIANANFVQLEDTKFESNFTDTDDEVILLANTKDATNIKFKFSPP